MGHFKNVVDTTRWISCRYDSSTSQFSTTIGTDLGDKVEVFIERAGSPDITLVPSTNIAQPIQTFVRTVVIRSGDHVVWEVNGNVEGDYTY